MQRVDPCIKPRTRWRVVLFGAAMAAACGPEDEGSGGGRSPSSGAGSAEPVMLTALSPTEQVARAGEEVLPPAVLVTTDGFEPVANARVSFIASPEVGLQELEAVTGDDGVARAARWRLGLGAQTYQIEVRAAGSSQSLTFTADAASDFEIEVRYLSTFTEAEVGAIDEAVRRLRGLLVNEQPTVEVDGETVSSACGVEESSSTLVAGVSIYLAREPLDGPGGAVAQVGPCLFRDTGAPGVSVIRFDAEDLAQLGPRLDDVVLHQMGHALGFGVLWPELGLLRTSAVAENGPEFIGPEAGAEFAGDAPTLPVPVEGGTRAGESDIHWRDAVFPGELFTPLRDLTGAASEIDSGLSAVTAASFEDLGFYTVNRSAVEALSVDVPAGESFFRCEPLFQ